ncbi:MAG TPA: DNA gyrase C-terminal beta-propeller domain-containing protein, partial [Kofleriaceae bacterium]|nr:DNA gyrase C-terminal beta-propeller domain-containing protein [Kofleriaceae bacterium]
DVPATTGYGVPVQKLFKLADGERIVAAITLDPRAVRPDEMLAVSGRGFGQRFAIDPYLEATTRAGRKFARPPKGDVIIDVVSASEEDVVVVATRKGHVLYCRAGDINKLENPGKGVTVIKTSDDDEVIGVIAGGHRRDTLCVETDKGGKKFELHADPKKIKGRGGKGIQIVKRSSLKKTEVEPELILLATADGGKEVH